MQSLRYTNVLLTIVTACLLLQLIRDNAKPVSAAVRPPASAVQAVRVVSLPPVRVAGTPDVNIAAVYGMEWKKDSTAWGMPVTVVNPSVPVTAAGAGLFVHVSNLSLPVEVQNTWPLDVKVKNILPMPVEVQNTWPLDVKVKNIFPMPVEVQNSVRIR